MHFKHIISGIAAALAMQLALPSFAAAQGSGEISTAKTSAPILVTLETLTPLIGKWRNKENPESSTVISFEMIANNTVMVETWLRNGKARSLTLYHQDGADLMATHYCPQGNQPRLRMTADSQKGYIAFAFQDSTNLESLEDSHQHSLGLKLPTATTDFIRTESYLGANGENFSTLVLEPTM